MTTPAPMSMQLQFGQDRPDSDLLFISMYTKSYLHLASRLAISMQRQALPFAIYETPTVHCSISEKGSSDLAYTKSNFIRNVIRQTGKNIVYIDADCVVEKFPSLLFCIAKTNDFAIYNWLDTQENHVYLPYSISSDSPNLYKYSHNIEPVCETQLICSGAVQFWANSQASWNLLSNWQRTIHENENSADDHCLDYSFNNFDLNLSQLRYQWLPKGYSRYAWWIFDQPIINHPQIPNTTTNWKEIKNPVGLKRFYPEKFDVKEKGKQEDVVYLGSILPEKNSHFRLSDNGLIYIDPIHSKLWIERGIK